MTESLKHTPLHAAHVALGAKMVPYAGYEMPVQYEGIIAEHKTVRSGIGVFDVSHMGEFEITGPDRNAFVNRVTCNDISALEPGGVQYSAILSDEGTFVDDATVYRFEDKIMIVVNAANRAKAWEHIVDQKKGANVRLRDISDDIGLLAVQGPVGVGRVDVNGTAERVPEATADGSCPQGTRWNGDENNDGGHQGRRHDEHDQQSARPGHRSGLVHHHQATVRSRRRRAARSPCRFAPR